MNRNIAIYTKIPTPGLTANSESKTLFDLISESNQDFIENLEASNKLHLLNTFRVFVSSGTLGIMFDGNPVTQTTFIGVFTNQHFIENCDLKKVQVLGIGGDAVFTLQLAHIG